jgi:hypothetical protein
MRWGKAGLPLQVKPGAEIDPAGGRRSGVRSPDSWPHSRPEHKSQTREGLQGVGNSGALLSIALR